MEKKILSENKCFNGTLYVVEHFSKSTQTNMKFSIYLPNKEGKLPALTWLSGLTCTHDNFTTKAGAYKKASELGLMIIAPDTSPRGEDVPNDDGYDLGQGAGFYLDATNAPWDKHFKMDSYITKDLQELICSEFPVDINKQAISGHSMGGHGALILGLKNQDIFKSISAFSPIVAPMQTPWGQKALTSYFGEDKELWKSHDASELVKEFGSADNNSILIEQGTGDEFLENELKPELFVKACEASSQKVSVNMREGFDHSYYFISSFIDSHLAFHFENLN